MATIPTPSHAKTKTHAEHPTQPDATTSLPNPQYTNIKTTLLPPTTPHTFSSLPTAPVPPHIPAQCISSLSFHPVVEAALHLLNADLPSAHFLLRHMQAQPAWEAMFLHGILHRIEGDYGNARAWYGDVRGSSVFGEAWADRVGDEGRDGSGQNGFEDTGDDTGKDRAFRFLDRLETWRKAKPKDRREREEEELREISLNEIKKVLAFCERKFGTERVEEASGVWVQMGQKHKEKAAEMVVGGEGWREF